MASWACQGCRTVYAVGIPACPHCGSADYKEDGVAKASPETGATFYVAEGDDVPGDLPEGVRPVGPGAPAPEPEKIPEPEPEAEKIPEPEAVPEHPPVSAPKAEWVDHAVAAGADRDEAEAMTKADLVEAVREADPTPPRPNSPASSAPADAGQRP